MKIAVVGMGYVGIPEALLFTDIKWVDKVYGIQRKSETSGYKIDLLNSSKLPFDEPALKGYLEDAITTGKFECTDDYTKISDCSIIVVAVQTDDLNHLFDAVEKIGENILTRYNPLIILVSTIPPGTTDSIKLRLEQTGIKFRIVHAPERVMPRKAVENIRKYPRVIGGYDKKSIKLTKDLYKAIGTPSFIEMTPTEAEITKTAENGIRAVQIAMANELATICVTHRSNFYNVKRGVDSLTGEGVTRALLNPGAGVGGHCLPKDGRLLLTGTKWHDSIFKHAIDTNEEMPHYMWGITRNALIAAGKSVRGSTIAILGWSYLPNSSDTRNSPAIIFKGIAEYNGCNIIVYDPVCDIVPTFDELMSADAYVVITAHDVVIQQVAALLLHTTPKIIIDGRNIVDADKFIKAGWIYRGIGRGDKL